MSLHENKRRKESYPIRSIRLSKGTWEKLKEKRWKSQIGWEQFIISFLKNEKNN